MVGVDNSPNPKLTCVGVFARLDQSRQSVAERPRPQFKSQLPVLGRNSQTMKNICARVLAVLVQAH